MIQRIGLGIGSTAIRAVGVQGTRILWAIHAELADPKEIEATLIRLLSNAPISRWRKPEVVAAIGPSFSQTRKLGGLPATTQPGTLEKIIRQNPSRFFLRNGVALATTGVRPDGDGMVWAAAIDEPVLRAVRNACTHQRLTLRSVIPAIAAVGLALTDERLTWRDGDVRVELLLDGGSISGVRRTNAVTSEEDDPLTPVAALSDLGDDAPRFADAYGAALLGPDERLVIRRGDTVLGDTSVPRWRMASAATVATLAFVAALIMPILSAKRATARMESRLRELSPARTAGAEASSNLDKVMAALAEVAAFSSATPARSLQLRDLAGVLPAESAITVLRADSAGLTIVVLTPSASRLLDRIERTPAFESASMLGPVTREVTAGRQLDRVTIRMRHTDRGARQPRDPTP